MQVRTDLPAHLAEHLGLDPEDHDVRAVDGFQVAGDGPDAVFAGEMLAPFGPWMAGHDLGRIDELAAEDASDHGLGHHAGAHGRDRGVGQGGHRAEYSCAQVALWRRRGHRAATPAARATPVRKNRPVLVTCADSNPARTRAASSSAGS